jgi:hypothetical protein
MNEVERFLAITGMVESDNDPEAWGDGGFACGRYQDHASYYESWGPKKEDFKGKERSWDWCFEFAARKFFLVARVHKPDATLLQIGMARHLHGQIIWAGNDPAYATRWQACAEVVEKREQE